MEKIKISHSKHKICVRSCIVYTLCVAYVCIRAMLREGIVSGSICMSVSLRVCLSLHTKS